MVGIVVEYRHQVCPISLHLWIFTFFHLNWWDWIVIHTMSFSYSLLPIAPKIFLLYLSFFRGNFAKECTILGLVYPVWQIKTVNTVGFIIMWSLDSSLLSEYYWLMRSDTLSSSSSASDTHSSNFWSKVWFLCQFFLTCASRIGHNLYRGCVCWTLSKTPVSSSCCLWQVAITGNCKRSQIYRSIILIEIWLNLTSIKNVNKF